MRLIEQISVCVVQGVVGENEFDCVQNVQYCNDDASCKEKARSVKYLASFKARKILKG
jgi:hypothetical protein